MAARAGRELPRRPFHPRRLQERRYVRRPRGLRVRRGVLRHRREGAVCVSVPNWSQRLHRLLRAHRRERGGRVWPRGRVHRPQEKEQRQETRCLYQEEALFPLAKSPCPAVSARYSITQSRPDTQSRKQTECSAPLPPSCALLRPLLHSDIERNVTHCQTLIDLPVISLYTIPVYVLYFFCLYMYAILTNYL